MAEQRWLTAGELAEELRVPLKTVYAWRNRRSGPRGIRIGRHLRFERSEIETWLRSLEDDESSGRES